MEVIQRPTVRTYFQYTVAGTLFRGLLAGVTLSAGSSATAGVMQWEKVELPEPGGGHAQTETEDADCSPTPLLTGAAEGEISCSELIFLIKVGMASEINQITYT